MDLNTGNVWDALSELASSCDAEIVVRRPADGSCSAEGCESKATSQTLTGIHFCGDHLSQFYSPETLPLKEGVIGVSSIAGDDIPLIEYP